MTNDEARITKECRMTNDRTAPAARAQAPFGHEAMMSGAFHFTQGVPRICHWCFVILSSFVLRHSSFPLLALVALPGCQQQMADQPSYGPLQASRFFADGQASRPVVPGTVARGQLRYDPHLFEGIIGKNAKGEKQFVTEFPFPVTREVLLRGQERFKIYCSVCHGREGKGDGMVVQRGF